jgi:hypothetical protein
MNLGITVERKPDKFVKSLEYMYKNYLTYLSNLERFKEKLDWNRIANQHLEIYNNSVIRTSHIPNPVNTNPVIIQS